MGGNGVTRNVCRNGALIESRLLPPVDTELMVTVTLNVIPGDEMKTRLSGRGYVKHIYQELNQPRRFGVEVCFRTENAT